MEKYDICVVGAGPAGYAAAMRAIDFGKKVLLVDKNKVGGAGLYDGALSSKTLWELSKDVNHTHNRVGRFGINCDFNLDFKVVKQELDTAVNERAYQLESHLAGLLEEGYKNVFFLKYGAAKLKTKNEIEITTNEGVETVYAENIIIATGSRPRKLPHIPIDENIIVTSDSIHQWDKLPKSLVILGAGVIGCEYATIYSNFGETKVKIIDKAPRIIPFEDEDVSEMVTTQLEKNGVEIHHGAQLIRMEIIDGEVEYEIDCNGTRSVHRVEKALISVGRVPNTQGLGLEDVGVKLTERGSIWDDDTQTSVPNIYAIGDVTADIALVNVGELEGRHAIKRIVGESKGPLSYDNICSIMFLKPIVASVGMNEKQCREKGVSYQVVKLDYRAIPRAIAMRNPPGFFKILVTNDKEMKVLGMRVVGAQASTAIQAVGLLMYMNKGVEELAEMIHPHPSLIEGIQECCRVLLGKSIFKPQVMKDYIDYRGYTSDQFDDVPNYN